MVCLIAASLAPSAEPELIVELKRDRIDEGESVEYWLTLNNVRNPAAPTLPKSPDYSVEELGEQDLNFQSVMIINGRRSEVRRVGRLFGYRLTPKRTGEITIPAPTAVVDGKLIQGKPATLRVRPAAEQNIVILNLSVDPPKVYPLQPFQVELKILVKGLPDPLANRNPVTALRSRRSLMVPWVDDKELPPGIQPTEPLDQWLGPLKRHDGVGFVINNLGQRTMFSLFDDVGLTFELPAEPIERPDAKGKMTTYWQYTLARQFTARQTGAYTFGPAVLKGDFSSGLNRAGRLAFESIHAVGRAVEVVVKEVPLEGRPEGFTGAVGRFTFSADLSPREARVGDPMTLTLRMQGKGLLNASAPDLTKIPAIAERFRVYEGTAETEGDVRRFTYSIRPTKAEVTEFPAVPLSYFDVDKEQFVTASTRPIPIRVKEGTALSAHEIVGQAAPPGAAKDRLEATVEGLYANVSDPRWLAEDRVSAGRWAGAVGAMAGVYLLTIVVSRVRRQWQTRGPSQTLASKQRARQRLDRAWQAYQQANPRSAGDWVRLAFLGVIADRAAVPEEGMTVGDVQNYLSRWNVAPALIQRVCHLLERCDQARYSAAPLTLTGIESEAHELLEQLTHAISPEGKRGR